MNEQKPRKIRNKSSHHKSPQRRVSFSKPWTPTNYPVDHVRSRQGSKDKASPQPHGTSRSILCKTSSKLDKSQNSKGVSARIKKHDASSSTTLDTRRRSQSDPTPAHLKYGMFRRFSKLRKNSDIMESPPSSPKRRSTDIKPIPVARSITSRRDSSTKITELPPMKRSINSSITRFPLPPPQPHTKHVHLSRTEPIHLDIKPKRFPSMLWF